MSAEQHYLARLDALRANAFHRSLLLQCSLAWAAAGVALGAAITVDVVAAGIGAGLGSIAGGLAADRYGRQRGVALGLAVAGLGMLASIGVPTAGAALASLGAGLVAPAALTLIAEYAPRASRARWSLPVVIAPLVGITASASLVLVLPTAAIAGLAAAAALLMLVLARRLPESPRWLAARGRSTEADAAVRRVERWRGGAPLISVARVEAPSPTIWGRGPGWGFWVALAVLVILVGGRPTGATAVGTAAALVLIPLAAFAADAIGRRLVIGVLFAVSLLLAFYGGGHPNGPTALASLTGTAGVAVVALVAAEVAGPRRRATAAGIMLVAVGLVPRLAASGSPVGGWVAAGALFGVLLALGLRETRAKPLEELSGPS